MDIIFQLITSIIFLFLCGAWTVAPINKDENLSKNIQILLSVFWASLGLLFFTIFSFDCTVLVNNYQNCSIRTLSCAFIPELQINLFYGTFGIVFYYLGFLLGQKYNKRNHLT